MLPTYTKELSQTIRIRTTEVRTRERTVLEISALTEIAPHLILEYAALHGWDAFLEEHGVLALLDVAEEILNWEGGPAL